MEPETEVLDFRRYANIIKKYTILKYTKQNGIIIDFGSGKGGDLYKYLHTPFKRCYLVEPYFHKQLEQRLYNINGKEKFEVIRHTAQYGHLQNIIKAKADNLFMFFSLNFFNDITISSLINNINNVLSKDGIVVMTYMDGEKVFELLKKYNGKYENKNYSIYDIDKIKRDVLGHKIKVCVNGETISMKGQIEYLVPHYEVEGRMRNINCTLIETMFFNEFKDIKKLNRQDYEFISMYRVDVYKKK